MISRRRFFKAIAGAAAGLVVARYLPQPKPEPQYSAIMDAVRKMRANHIKPITIGGEENYVVVVSPENYAALKKHLSEFDAFEGIRVVPMTDIIAPPRSLSLWGAA